MRTRRESGHALIEVMLLGLVLMVPIAWLLSVFAELHAAALGTSAAAREAGFEAARASDAASADLALTRLVEQSVEDHGLDPRRVEVKWSPAPGWQRGGSIEVLITYEVPVFQAPLLGSVSEPAVSVTAAHVATIDRYRSREP